MALNDLTADTAETVKALDEALTAGTVTLTTELVATWFVSRCVGLGRLGRELAAEGHCWAPAATRSLAVTAIGGDIGQPVAESPNLNGYGSYEWYDLSDVGINGIVWRISSGGTLDAFLRTGDDDWWTGVRHKNIGDLVDPAIRLALARSATKETA